MSEVKGISNIGLNQDNNIKTVKTANTGNTAFSSYLEEKKSLDDIFDRASKQYNVPVELLKAIGKAESDFRVDAVSRCGAQGVMQLMPATAASLGVTDAFDPEQNIFGGTKYISDLLKKYDGNTSLALAAYNAGMGNVAKYGGIPPFEETQNYVVKVTNYMKQNLEAGSVTISAGTGSTFKGSMTKSPSLPAATPPNWYLTPSKQTQQAETLELTNLLNSIFSYEDYLKLLELFYEDSRENENTQYMY